MSEIFYIFAGIIYDMSQKEFIQRFSNHLFWDVDKAVIDPAVNAPYIIQRVLEYGEFTDWKNLVSYYGMEHIVSVSKNLRSLEPRALSFISTVSDTPVNKFRCFTTRQSTPEHCNF